MGKANRKGPKMLGVTNLSKSFEEIVAVDSFTLDISGPELVVLLGPSGCGKTTLIRLIAGLETPDGGVILFEGRDCTHLSPQKRNVAMVFQNYALYPNRTVKGNIEYPLRLRRLEMHDIDAKVRDISELLGLSTLMDRKPSQLSGGEAQRVALASALVREPCCFLMDEPLSNLDAQLRVRARAEIKRIQRELRVTTIYVTHDQEDAVALGDRVAIMNRGKLIQIGTPEELYSRPATTFVASFLGSPPMNLVRGTVIADSPFGFGVVLKTVDSKIILLRGFDAKKLQDGYNVYVGFRPDHIGIRTNNLSADPGETVLSAQVEMIEGLEPHFVVHCRTAVGLIIVRTSHRASLGSTEIVLRASQAHIFDGETGDRIEWLAEHDQ